MLCPFFFGAPAFLPGGRYKPGDVSVASRQWPPCLFLIRAHPPPFLIASLYAKPRGRIQVWGYSLCWLPGLNLAEAFRPRVTCHLAPDGMVLVGGPPQAWGAKHLLSERPPGTGFWFPGGVCRNLVERTGVLSLARSHPLGAKATWQARLSAMGLSLPLSHPLALLTRGRTAPLWP